MSDAVEASTLAVEGARARGDAPALADVLLRHADALVRSGRLADAGTTLDEAARIHRARGARLDEARCLRLGATALRLQGRLEAAGAHAQAALALLADPPFEDAPEDLPEETAAARAELGEIALTGQDAAAAIAAFEAAIAASSVDMPALRRGLARALALAGRFEPAAEQLGEAARLEDAAGHTAAALRAIVEAASAWQQARRFDRAQVLVAEALPRAHASADEEALAGLALLSTTHALEQGQAPVARAHALAARSHALASRAAGSYIGAAVALSRIDEQAGDRVGAYGALATGWATLGDLLGAELSRGTFEPLMRAMHARWGAEAFDAARAGYEAARRATIQGAVR